MKNYVILYLYAKRLNILQITTRKSKEAIRVRQSMQSHL